MNNQPKAPDLDIKKTQSKKPFEYEEANAEVETPEKGPKKQNHELPIMDNDLTQNQPAGDIRNQI